MDDRRWVSVADAAALLDDAPLAASVDGVDLVVVKRQGSVAVFQGRCPHEGVLLAEGHLQDGVLTCRGHGWRFDCATGTKVGEPRVCLRQFAAVVEGGQVMIERAEIAAWKRVRSNGSANPPSSGAGRHLNISDLP